MSDYKCSNCGYQPFTASRHSINTYPCPQCGKRHYWQGIGPTPCAGCADKEARIRELEGALNWALEHTEKYTYVHKGEGEMHCLFCKEITYLQHPIPKHKADCPLKKTLEVLKEGKG